MSDETAVYDRLRASAAVCALIGTHGTGSPTTPNVFPVIAPQDVSGDFIVYSLVSTIPTDNFDAAPTLDNRRVQVDCYSRVWETARAISQAARTALEPIGHIASENPDDYEADTKLFRKSFDISLWLER